MSPPLLIGLDNRPWKPFQQCPLTG